MRGALLAASVVALGGCNRDIDIVLAPLGGCDSPCGETDLSCLTHIGFFAAGATAADEVELCLEVPPGAARKLCDHDLADLMEVPAPRGLTYVAIYGFRGYGCDFEQDAPIALFGGGAYNKGRSKLAVPLQCSLDCRTLDERLHRVRLVDLEALVEFGICIAPPNVGGFRLWLGILHDWRRFFTSTRADDVLEPLVIFDPFYEVNMTGPPSVSGVATLSGKSFLVEPDSGCLAVFATDSPDFFRNNSTYCLPPGDSRGACTVRGESELLWVDPYVSYLIGEKLDSVAEPGWYFVGVAWDPVAGAPVEGAVVEDLPAGSYALYVDLIGGSLRDRSGVGTGPSGLFLVAGDTVGTVTLRAPGFQSRQAMIAVPMRTPSSAVVVLDRED
jgi:hypothetical protein